MQEGRIKWIDHVRAFAMLSIVLGHAIGEFDASNQLKIWVYLFHVPLCVIVSGYLFRDKSGVRDSLQHMKKVLLREYVPYLFWGAVSIIAYLVVIDRGDLSKIPLYIGGLFYGSGSIGADTDAGSWMIWNRPLWYLPCIIMIEASADLLSLIRFKHKKIVFFAVFSAAGVVIYRFLHPHYFFMELESVVYLMPFFWFGALLREKEAAMNGFWSKKAVCIGVSAAMIAAGSVLGFQNGKISYLSDSLGTSYFVFLTAALLICAGVMFIEKCLNCSGRFLTYIGQNTLMILLTHKFTIIACSMVIKKVFMPSGFVVVTAVSLAITVVATAVSLAAGFVFTKFAPVLIGKPRKKLKDKGMER